jgi:hypothetical protein
MMEMEGWIGGNSFLIEFPRIIATCDSHRFSPAERSIPSNLVIVYGNNPRPQESTDRFEWAGRESA